MINGLKDYTLDEYLKRNGSHTDCILVSKIHSLVKDEIKIYYEDAKYAPDRKSRFLLFHDNIFVSNGIWFNCPVEKNDIEYIAQKMFEELKESSDFTDLDREMEGHAACKEYENTYKKCDDCPRYKFAKNHIETDDDCWGPMYSIPHHMNSWKVEKEFIEKYSENSEYYKTFLKEQACDILYPLLFTKNKESVQRAIETIKNI